MKHVDGAALERRLPFVREEPYVCIEEMRCGYGERHQPVHGDAAHCAFSCCSNFVLLHRSCGQLSKLTRCRHHLMPHLRVQHETPMSSQSLLLGCNVAQQMISRGLVKGTSVRTEPVPVHFRPLLAPPRPTVCPM